MYIRAFEMSCLIDIVSYLTLCLRYFIYYIAWKIAFHVQNILYSKRTSFKGGCRVFNIVWRCKFEIIDESSPKDFIAFHDMYTTAQYVLKETISLYCITKDSAFFVETDVLHNVLQSECCPFQYMGQFKHAHKLIELPLASFYQLSDRLGDPVVNVCFLLNTGRCGSTVLARALENIPGTLQHAEPGCLTNLVNLWKRKSVSQSEYEQSLQASIRFLCKPGQGVDRICIKPRNCGTCHISAINKLFPRFKIIFLYRNIFPTILSCLSVPEVSQTIKSIRLFLINNDTVAYYFPYFRRQNCPPGPVVSTGHLSFVELLAITWAVYISLVRDFKRQGGKVVTVRYEEMTADKVKTLENLFQLLDININFITDALKAFDRDSQAGTLLSRENKRSRKISAMDRIKANQILAKYDLLGLEEDFIL